ncbi:MAG: HYR domain-containing protein [Gammaproteobacteria bacterium]|nr:HYR domain-containing protein [Gammaproteobacteria bacterium]
MKSFVIVGLTLFVNLQAIALERVSVNDSGAQANNNSFMHMLSADGRFVVFDSMASNLVAGDTNSSRDVFVYDTVNASVERVSVDSNGNEMTGLSRAPSISADGRFIVFESQAVLATGGTAGTFQIYLHDRQDRTTRLISANSSGTAGNGHSNRARITEDGSQVLFHSSASNLSVADGNPFNDVFIKHLSNGNVELVSRTYSGAQADNHSLDADFSRDGRYVVFISQATNMTSDSVSGLRHLYLRDRQLGTTRLLSGAANGSSYAPDMSGDGAHIVFYTSASNLASGMNGSGLQVMNYDIAGDSFRLVSQSAGGVEGNDHSYSPAISDDGSVIVYTSFASNLVTADTNSNSDVFLYEREAATNQLISRSEASLGNGNTVGGPSISANGIHIAFSSYANNLVANDTNAYADTFLYSRQVNRPPQADAGADRTLECAGVTTPVTLDGRGSSDADGDTLSYLWQGPFGSDEGAVVTVPMALGTNHSTLVVEDNQGGSDEDQVIVTLEDNVAPVLDEISPVTLEASSPAGAEYSLSPDARDLCGAVTINVAPELAVYPLGETRVTVVATDNSGNSDQTEVRVTVEDTTAPVLTLPADIVGYEATARETPVDIGQAEATDIFDVVLANDAPMAYALGQTAVTWSATDSNGNRSEAVQSIGVVDTTAPSLSAPADITREASAILTPVAIGEAETSDIFDVSVSHDGPTAYPLGSTAVTWTATDSNGNESRAQQQIIIEDTTAPKLIQPADITAEAQGESTVVELSEPQASDIFEVNLEHNGPTAYPLGSTEVTWTATDSSGNRTSVSHRVTVQDTIPPVLNVPGDITREASAILTPVAIGEAETSDIFDVSVSHDGPTAYPLGSTAVTWTATDSNGNESRAQQQIIIEDTTAPKLIQPADITAEAQGESTVVELSEPQASDIFEVNLEHNGPTAYPLGSTEVTWTATDSSGNRTSVSHRVTVQDTIPPVLNVPGDITQEASAILTPVQLGTAEATDIFDVSLSNDAPAAYPLGTTQVTWSALDSNGNQATAVQGITIVDTTPPQLAQPADIEAEALAKTTTVSLEPPQASDIFELTLENDAPAAFPLGSTRVTWQATDLSGNVTTVSHLITVRDTVSPSLTPPADMVVEAEGVLTAVVLGEAHAEDRFAVTLSNDAPPLFPLGTTIVTWRAEDSNGNVTQAQQRVTVVDTTAPTMEFTQYHDSIWPPNHRLIKVARIANLSDQVDSQPQLDVEVDVEESSRFKRHRGEHHGEERWSADGHERNHRKGRLHRAHDKHEHKRKHRHARHARHHHEHKQWKLVEKDGAWYVYVRASLKGYIRQRIYHIEIRVTDASGNTTLQSAQVVVGKDKWERRED